MCSPALPDVGLTWQAQNQLAMRKGAGQIPAEEGSAPQHPVDQPLTMSCLEKGLTMLDGPSPDSQDDCCALVLHILPGVSFTKQDIHLHTGRKYYSKSYDTGRRYAWAAEKVSRV